MSSSLKHGGIHSIKTYRTILYIVFNVKYHKVNSVIFNMKYLNI